MPNPKSSRAHTRVFPKKYHPDLNASPDAVERMKAINAAYAILGDPVKRAQYDRTRTMAPSAGLAETQIVPPSSTAPPTQTTTYCVNHPQTETYLRCNKCGKPVCIKCVQRTPVGYRCKECLGEQRAGYYNATWFDYPLTALIALVFGALSGFLILLIGSGFFGIIIAIFVGPIAGGIISEAIRRVIAKRRGRYTWLVACAALVIGALAVLYLPVLPFLAGGLSIFLQAAVRVSLNLGFWVFLGIAVSTTYARLRI